ncbi:unnamed protein product [Lampetra planeri]
MAAVKYQRGDTVMGRWPGSNLYYEVKVLDFDSKSQLYTVIYKDGTELELREQDIRQSEAKTDAEPEKNQSRYNLRRRKDDGEAKAAETKEPLAEKEDKMAAAPAASLSSSLDFGGKLGVYFWMLFLPAWVLFVVLQVNLVDPSLANFPPPLPPLEAFWDAQALGFVILWILFHVVLYILPVGKLILVSLQLSEGMPLRSGQRLTYRTNGFFAIVLSAAVAAAAVHQGVDLTYIHSHFLPLTVATFLISVLLSIYLYVRSRYAAPDQLALGGNSGEAKIPNPSSSFFYVHHLLTQLSGSLLVLPGSFMYDFFKGRELNPRIKDFDLKFFCEMRPG